MNEKVFHIKIRITINKATKYYVILNKGKHFI